MAANKGTIVSALVRVANAGGNPTAFLMDIIQGRYTRTIDGSGRTLISSSTGGSSANWVVPPGMTDLEIIELAELALQRVETQVDAGTDPSTGLPYPIQPTSMSNRIVTYGIFNNIAR